MLSMQCYACVYFLLLLLLITATCIQAVNINHNMTCPDILPQRSLDLDQVMGTWYVVESAHHSAVTPIREGKTGTPKGHLTCAVFHLELLNETTVLLEWEQQQSYPALEYTLTIPDVTSPGSWVVQKTPWRWLDGTPREQVHVMKAVGDHAALTFCQPGAGGHVFTAVLGRRNHLTLQQIRGVNAMLQRRGLEVIETRHMDEALCNKHRAWKRGSESQPGFSVSTASYGITTHHLSNFIIITYVLATSFFIIKWV